MTARVTPFAVLLAALALALAACDTGEPYVPPCEPVPGSSVDPCEPDLPWSERGDYTAGSAPWSMRFFLDEWGRSEVYVSHLAVRGTYLPGTVRCVVNGLPFRRPPYISGSSLASFSNNILVNCYADVRVNAYVLGSGPPTLTVLLGYGFSPVDPPDEEKKYVDEYRSSLERDIIEGGHYGPLDVPAVGIEGRELILFVGPTVDASTEAWRVFAMWDVQRREDGTAIAIHPEINYWRTMRNYEAYRYRVEMELPAFTRAVTGAHRERVTENNGRTAAVEGFPRLVTEADRLTAFMTEIGAYDHPGGPPVKPPPPCGLAVPDQPDNPGLVRDCMTLLAAKDTLRGTGRLNWGTGTTIGSWDGVTTSSDPSGVTKLLLSDEDLSGTIPPELGDLFEITHLDLSSNSLTGEIPRELGKLPNLVSIRLSGNSLTGCIPTALKDVATNGTSAPWTCCTAHQRRMPPLRGL